MKEKIDNKRKLKRRKILIKKYLGEIFLLFLGCFFLAISTSLFLLPNQLSTGGFSGLATIVYYFFKIPLGTVLIALNIPLFILGYLRVGKQLFFKAFLGTLLYSVLTDILDSIAPVLTNDRLLASIYGGVFSGIGTGFILKASASTGGSDLLSYIIKSYKQDIKNGTIIVSIDSTIVLLNTIFFHQIEIALYSIVAIFIMNRMIDIIFEGVNYTKLMYIVSPKYEYISKQISKKVNRGSTGIKIRGMFKKEDGTMLLCVGSRSEIDKMRKIALKVDPTSFIVIMDARQAWGKGFRLNREQFR